MWWQTWFCCTKLSVYPITFEVPQEEEISIGNSRIYETMSCSEDIPLVDHRTTAIPPSWCGLNDEADHEGSFPSLCVIATYDQRIRVVRRHWVRNGLAGFHSDGSCVARSLHVAPRPGDEPSDQTVEIRSWSCLSWGDLGLGFGKSGSESALCCCICKRGCREFFLFKFRQGKMYLAEELGLCVFKCY